MTKHTESARLRLQRVSIASSECTPARGRRSKGPPCPDLGDAQPVRGCPRGSAVAVGLWARPRSTTAWPGQRDTAERFSATVPPVHREAVAPERRRAPGARASLPRTAARWQASMRSARSFQVRETAFDATDWKSSIGAKRPRSAPWRSDARRRCRAPGTVEPSRLEAARVMIRALEVPSREMNGSRNRPTSTSRVGGIGRGVEGLGTTSPGLMAAAMCWPGTCPRRRRGGAGEPRSRGGVIVVGPAMLAVALKRGDHIRRTARDDGGGPP